MPRETALDAMPTVWLSRPCPSGAKKHVGGGPKWAAVREAVLRRRRAVSNAAATGGGAWGGGSGGGGGGAQGGVLFRLCGDVSGVPTTTGGASGGKYDFASTGTWWRARRAAAAAAALAGQATPLFDAAGGRAAVHVAVHIRRGDMVYRNFYKQLSPDRYYVQAMWHVLQLLRSAPHRSPPTARPRVVFHIFSQPPPRTSWTGRAQVPLRAGRDAEYVDELGCAASLRAALATLVGDDGSDGGDAGGGSDGHSGPDWELRMQLDANPVDSLRHMASATVLIASDSSFSLLAAVLSHGLVLVRQGWRRFAPGALAGVLHPVTLTENGAFNCADAMQHFRATQRHQGRI